MVDTADLKSAGSDTVRVRVPPRVLCTSDGMVDIVDLESTGSNIVRVRVPPRVLH